MQHFYLLRNTRCKANVVYLWNNNKLTIFQIKSLNQCCLMVTGHIVVAYIELFHTIKHTIKK